MIYYRIKRQRIRLWLKSKVKLCLIISQIMLQKQLTGFLQLITTEVTFPSILHIYCSSDAAVPCHVNFGSQLMDQPLFGALLIVLAGGNWQKAFWLLKLLLQNDLRHFLSYFTEVTHSTLTLTGWGNTIKDRHYRKVNWNRLIVIQPTTW